MAASKNPGRKDQDKPEPEENLDSSQIVTVTKAVTVQGIKVDVAVGAMKKLSVVEAMDDMHSQRNPFAIVTVFREVFGDEQYKKIKEHLEKKHGSVELEHMSDFFTAALKKVSPNS